MTQTRPSHFGMVQAAIRELLAEETSATPEYVEKVIAHYREHGVPKEYVVHDPKVGARIYLNTYGYKEDQQSTGKES